MIPDKSYKKSKRIVYYVGINIQGVMLLKVTALTPMKENKMFITHYMLVFKPSVSTNRLLFILF